MRYWPICGSRNGCGLYGGDLPYGGSNPAEVIDCVVQEGWKGVLGNTDEMLWTTLPGRRWKRRAQAEAAVQGLL